MTLDQINGSIEALKEILAEIDEHERLGCSNPDNKVPGEPVRTAQPTDRKLYMLRDDIRSRLGV